MRKTALKSLVVAVCSAFFFLGSVAASPIPKESTDPDAIKIIRTAFDEYRADNSISLYRSADDDFDIGEHIGKHQCGLFGQHVCQYVFDSRAIAALDGLPNGYSYGAQRITKKTYRLVIRDEGKNIIWADDGVIENLPEKDIPARNADESTAKKPRSLQLSPESEVPTEMQYLKPALEKYYAEKGERGIQNFVGELNLARRLMDEKSDRSQGPFLSVSPVVRDRLLAFPFVFSMHKPGDEIPPGCFVIKINPLYGNKENPSLRRGQLYLLFRQMDERQLSLKHATSIELPKENSNEEIVPNEKTSEEKPNTDAMFSFLMSLGALAIVALGTVLAFADLGCHQVCRDHRQCPREDSPAKPEYTDR